MKKTRRGITFLLVFTMLFTTVGQVFASDINIKLITLENGTRVTEQELIELLNSYDGELNKVSKNTLQMNKNIVTHDEMTLQSSYSVAAMPVAIPLWAIGEWVIPFIGTVIITPIAIYVGDKIIKAGSVLYNEIITAIDNIIFAQKNPTGRKVKDVHKRLKKEGFKKTGQNGSHEKWKKDGGGDKLVIVPNHGENSDIPIGTLRSIWKQAGWL